ncbi:oxidative stress 3 [Perilla frutescens var. frutescens]|nr:oxidative stress 3 [Perilla frutescens var. frutescens]
MEGGKSDHLFQDSWFQFEDQVKNNIDHDERCTSSSANTSSIGEDSDASNGSSITSSDTADDASSSASSSLNSSPSGALYNLSEIMDQLPIKRGLSQFYQGKSESFTTLSRVTSIEDLVKKATPYRRNLKASKSCGTGLHSYKQFTLPKAIISKKSARGVSLSSFPSKKGSFMHSKPPLTPLHQDLEC